MANCPTCSSVLEHDFGMVTCSGCGAVLMININGEVIQGSDQANPENMEWDQDQALESSTFAPDEGPTENWSDPLPEQGNGFFAVGDEGSPMVEPAEYTEPEAPGWSEASEPTGSSESAEAGPEEMQNFFSVDEGDESSEMETSQPVSESVLPSQPDPEPVNVTAFANSEASSLEGGELLYDLWVSGLDSKDLRDTFKAVIMDKKLKLNEVGLMKSIRGGKVLIPSLNPVKAKRIVEQLQFFDLRIEWKQKRVVMADTALTAQETDGGADHDL